jgi:hypothetical protein
VIRPAALPLRLPRASPGSVPTTTAFDGAMQQLEQADVANVKQGTTPAFPAVILTSPSGASWRVLVADDGTLHTSAVPR